MHELVHDRHYEVRREALLALVRQRDPQAPKLASDWLHDLAKQANVTRDLAIRCVHELDLRKEIPEVRKYLSDSNEAVQIAAIVALSQWGDDESRGQFEIARNSKSLRIRNAGNAAIERLDSLDRIVPPEMQTVENLTIALHNPKSTVRHAAARVLRKYGDKISPAIPALIEATSRLDNTARTGDIAGYLQTVRNAKAVGLPAADAIVGLLEERSSIYSGRSMDDVHHIRAYMILTLADIGAAQKALPYIAEYLNNADQQLHYPFACAAHAVQFLNHSSSLVPALQRGLSGEFADNPLSLSSFVESPDSIAVATSPRLETIRALASIGPDAASAIPLLKPLQTVSVPKFGSRYGQEARRAISMIQKARLDDKGSQ